ncbi:MAG TPA: substrate-binding domain-containing protein [Candidatus Hydrogenedentes bacterium]|nr:substrate-binding domain-containing protein [Candidatus Hydrogenedentota bacterium]HOL76541.1 substrate-binding domain-containing protein [Candidatus Hydrogenedentota bacterium]
MKELLASKIAQKILTDFFQSGRLKQGDRLPRLGELAEKYDASIATVAHAVGQLQALGYVRKGGDRRAYVNLTALNNGGRTAGGTIGLVIPGDGHARLLMWIHEGAQRACQYYGLSLTMASTGSFFAEREREVVASMYESGCQAIILTPGIRTESEIANDYLNREFLDIPIVLVDMAFPQQRRSQVVFDNFASGFAMTQLLLSKGHSKIVFMTVLGCPEKMMWRSNLDRYQGYLAALRYAGIAPDAKLQWHCNPRRPAFLEEEIQDWLLNWKKTPKSERATAVIALDDMTAITFVSEAIEAGIAVPEDLIVVGFDNTSEVPPIRREYYTTKPDFAAAGEKAVHLAMQHLNGEIDSPVVYILPAPVVRRTRREVEIVRIPTIAAQAAALNEP